MFNKRKFIIKNIETGEYFTGWEFPKDAQGRYMHRPAINSSSWGGTVIVKNPLFSKKETPKLYNTYGGARKIISEFVGSSYAKVDKLNQAQKVLFADSKLTKYEIVECKVKLVDVKKKLKVDKIPGNPS